MLTDQQIDAIDADFVLSHFAPRGAESVRAFARAIERATAEEAARQVHEEDWYYAARAIRQHFKLEEGK